MVLVPMLALPAALGVSCGGADDSDPSHVTESATGSGGTSTNAASTGVGGSGGEGGTNDGGGGSTTTGICPREHEATTTDGHAVTVCDETYDEPPYVRPPADSGSVAYVATDAVRLFVRGQEPRELSSDEQNTMNFSMSNVMNIKRTGYAIYRVTFDDAGSIVESAPAILIEDAAFLAFFEGMNAEGMVSRHKPDPELPNFQYEQTPSLPIRMHFSGISPLPDGGDWADVIHLSQIGIMIENLSGPIESSAAECMPALTDAGQENPFAGQASVTLRGTRVPAMHVPGDNAFVLEGSIFNHMAPWLITPADLVSGDPIDLAPSGFAPHGNPLGMPALNLAVVEGGGADCGR